MELEERWRGETGHGHTSHAVEESRKELKEWVGLWSPMEGEGGRGTTPSRLW